MNFLNKNTLAVISKEKEIFIQKLHGVISRILIPQSLNRSTKRLNDLESAHTLLRNKSLTSNEDDEKSEEKTDDKKELAPISTVEVVPFTVSYLLCLLIIMSDYNNI